MKRLILLITVVGLLGIAGLGAWTYSNLHKPIAHAKTGQYIEIPKGTSPGAIVHKLATEGVIKHEWPLKLYLKATGKGSTLRAGEYDFPSPISPLAVVSKLAGGATDMRKGMNGLALQVQEVLKRDPHAGDLYIFRGRRGNLLKILWHDGLGMSLYAKRLERGRFIWPSPADASSPGPS